MNFVILNAKFTLENRSKTTNAVVHSCKNIDCYRKAFAIFYQMLLV